MGKPIFSPDSGLSSNSDELRSAASNHRRKQELKVLEDVEEMEAIVVEEVLEASDEVERFFADTVDDYLAEEEIVMSEDAESGAKYVLIDRSNDCFEDFMKLAESSEPGDGQGNAAEDAHDSLSKLLADSGLQYYPPAAAGASAEEELTMMAFLDAAEPETAEETSHFVRRSQRKRSLRVEELVDEDSEDESPPRRKGGRSKARRPRKVSRRPRSQPPEERAGPSRQRQQSPPPQQHQQQFLQQQPAAEPHPQQQQQLQMPHQQQQFPRQQLLLVSQQFPQQQQSQVPQQQHQEAQQITQPQIPQQHHQILQQQMPPPPPPQQLLSTLPATATMDTNEMLLNIWNNFMFNYIRKLPKDKLRYLDARLNDRLLGRLPPIQREPGWLEEFLRD